MDQKHIVCMMRQIDRYIKGQLNKEQIDQLWMEFLKEPEWVEISETDLHLRHYLTKSRK